MKKLNVLMAAAMLFAPVAFAGDQGDFMQYSSSVQVQKVKSTRAERRQTASSGSSLQAKTRKPGVMDSDYRVPPSNQGE